MNRDVKRLLDELRLLGPAGVERAAESWRRAAESEDAIRTAAEKREVDDPDWQEAEAEIFHVAATESWRSLPQTDRDSATAAAQDALLALLQRGTLSRGDFRRMVSPLGSALPWLLTGEAEDRY